MATDDVAASPAPALALDSYLLDLVRSDPSQVEVPAARSSVPPSVLRFAVFAAIVCVASGLLFR